MTSKRKRKQYLERKVEADGSASGILDARLGSSGGISRVLQDVRLPLSTEVRLLRLSGLAACSNMRPWGLPELLCQLIRDLCANGLVGWQLVRADQPQVGPELLLTHFF